MKHKRNRILTILTGMLLITVCFFCTSIRTKAHGQNAVCAVNGACADMTVNNNSQPADTDTGVEDLDEAADRGIGILEGLTKAGGLACGIIGIVIAAIGFFGHQEDMKAKAPIFIFVGVIIFFAKEIFEFLVGK